MLDGGGGHAVPVIPPKLISPTIVSLENGTGELAAAREDYVSSEHMKAQMDDTNSRHSARLEMVDKTHADSTARLQHELEQARQHASKGSKELSELLRQTSKTQEDLHNEDVELAIKAAGRDILGEY